MVIQKLQDRQPSKEPIIIQRRYAAEAVQRILAGIRIQITHDLGDYTEIVQALIASYEAGGLEAVRRTYSVLRRADHRLAQLEADENIYPPEQLFEADDLARLDSFPYTDQGQAEALAHIYGGHRLRYSPGLGWLVWNGNCWRSDDRGAVYQYAVVTSRARQNAVYNRQVDQNDKKEFERKMNDIRWALRSENKPRLEAAIELAAKHPAIVTNIEDFDADPFLISVRNGVIDLRSGHLRAAQPDDLLTRTISISYFPDATCHRWERFLSEVFQGDKDLIDYIWRCIGYSLTGDTTEHVFWVMHGVGGNGKSRFIEVLMNLLGEYSANTPFNTFIEGKQTNAGDDLARLRGKRLVTASESSGGARLNEERIKAVTGGDYITARFLFKSYFSFKPQFHVWLSTNHKPVIGGTDIGIWRRVRLIPFNVKFDEAKADRKLDQKLNDELPGILAWAVRGCIEWQQRGLTVPEAVNEATTNYREEMDIVGRFLSEECGFSGSYKSKAASLYKAYSGWCDDNGIKALSNVVFSQKLKERGFTKSERTMSGFYWLGIGILAESEA